jgi:hypothetical protein
VAVVAGSSRRRAFHNPRGRLRPRRGTRAGQVTPGAAAAVAGGGGARAVSTEGELNIWKRKRAEGWVEMMQVDYISLENLKYIILSFTHSRDPSRQAVKPIGYNALPRSRPHGVPDHFQTTSHPYPYPSLTILAAVLPCPTFLTKSLSCTQTTLGLPHASGCYDHCTSSQLPFP